MADSSTSSTVQSGEPAAIVRKGVAIAGIQVSVKKSEAHTYTSQATELAMESGATVTDHVILKPVTLAVTVAMTNAGVGRTRRGMRSSLSWRCGKSANPSR